MSIPARGSRRPRVPHERARERIAVAAERLLAHRRVAEITVDELMTEAGLARTVFYRHFTDVPQVVLELLERLGTDVLGASGPGPGPDLTEPDTLRAALRRTVDFHADHVRLILALDDAGRTDPAVAGAHADFVTRTVDRLATLLPGAGDRGEPARALVHLNTGYLMDAFTRTPPVRRADALDVLVRIWTGALAGLSDPAPPRSAGR